MMTGGREDSEPEEEAPGRGLSARGALIAGGASGLLEKGFDMYIRDPFDAERNPQVRAGAPWGGRGPMQGASGSCPELCLWEAVGAFGPPLRALWGLAREWG